MDRDKLLKLAEIAENLDRADFAEIVDDAGWSLSLCFGHGDKARDRMRAVSDALRALAGED